MRKSTDDQVQNHFNLHHAICFIDFVHSVCLSLDIFLSCKNNNKTMPIRNSTNYLEYLFASNSIIKQLTQKQITLFVCLYSNRHILISISAHRFYIEYVHMHFVFILYCKYKYARLTMFMLFFFYSC